MKLFTPRKDLKTPLFPIIKIIISIIIIVLSINRKEFYSFFNIEIEGIFDILERIIFLIIGVISILTIYMSVVEIIYTYENREDEKKRRKYNEWKYKPYSLEEIVSLVEKNDIIEIEIKTETDIVKIGSSSDCKAGSNKFFDKKFYIANMEYDDLKTFIDEIKIYEKDGYINAIFIDGIPVVKNKRTNK